jgi:hypothetical protein
MTPAHSDAMRNDYFAANKTWTLTLANQDSDGDGFTNGEELQDPSGAWAIGKPDPGDVSFVSNPSDSNINNNSYECDLNYRATPPEPLLLDVVGYADPANGDVTFGVSVRSPLPIDYVRYTVKKGGQTVYDFFSSNAPFSSDAWNTKAVADGSYTITARVVELRAKAGETGRSATRSETFAVDNGSPSFGPLGEVVGTPLNPCGISEALNGVAAISQSDVWAVGARSIDGLGERMLIKHWDGLRWTSVISPNMGTRENALNAVAASSAADVWAVGVYHDDSNFERTLIQHWDGSIWKISPSPNQGASHNRLAGVAALSASSAWAVGSYDDATSISLPLILRWNGSSWQSSSVPTLTGATEIVLNGVTAIANNNAWAVGSYRDSNGDGKTLILHWNGTSWQKVASPNPNSFRNALNAVTAVSAGDIWAVGSTSDGSGYKTLVLRWNGASWQTVSSPSPGSPNNELLGVAAVASDDVWAVGYSGIGHDDGAVLALHWNGTSWQATARPDSGTTTLNAADALGGLVWAAGAETIGTGVTSTLVERFWVTRPAAQLPVVTVSASDSSAAEAGPDSASFTIARTGTTAQPLTVHYSVSGTAIAGSDYPALAGQITIPGGQSSATIVVTPVNDTAVEGNETVVVIVSADPAYALGANASATVTIADDDTLTQTVTISASDPSAAENGPDSGTFTITRSGSTAASLSVQYSVGGTATSGSDYSLLPGVVTIPAGQASATVVLVPIDDAMTEASETVVVTLSPDPAYTLGTSKTATVTIADNDNGQPPRHKLYLPLIRRP